MALISNPDTSYRTGTRQSTMGKRLFTFAVVADGHVNPQEDTSSSPWESNRLANARNRFVVSELNQIAPAFVVHLGDMVHPLPSSPAYQKAIGQFNAIFNRLNCPIYLIPGNHDVGDKPSSWVPAGSVNDDYLRSYRRNFEKDFFSFKHKGCQFILLNCQLLGSNLPDEKAQFEWLKKHLASHRKERTFVFIHYPPFIRDPDEDEHYDNLREPGRSQILKIIESSNVEALFSGHVHNFFYNRLSHTDFYVLPSIAFVRHDYSELSRIEADCEFGRNDKGKLGFFTVTVYEKGHAFKLIRTWGRTLAPDENAIRDEKHIDQLSSRETWWPGLGLDMRHPWTESVELPYSGAVDEFVRKKVRNDYPVLALWEMGAKRMRLPWHDLANFETRGRMKALKNSGHFFTLFNYDTPSRELSDILIKNRDLIESLEIILPYQEIISKLNALSELRKNIQLPLYLSKLRSSADSAKVGSKFQHFIKHGFIPSEKDAIKKILSQKYIRKAADGFVFRIGRKEDLWENIPALYSFAQSMEVSAQFQVMLSNENPAIMECDDLANANRVAEALVLALALSGVTIYLDTFIDMDRGYFPRNGLVDRRYNPRLAAHVYRNLNSVLGPYSDQLLIDKKDEIPGVKICRLSATNSTFVIVLPEREILLNKLEIPLGNIPVGEKITFFNLATGVKFALKRKTKTQFIHFKGNRYRLETVKYPFLLSLESRKPDVIEV